MLRSKKKNEIILKQQLEAELNIKKEDRLKAEAEKQKAEAEKQKAETDQKIVEAERQKAESEQKKAETERENLIAKQKIAETEKEKADLLLKNQEEKRKEAEALKNIEEEKRRKAEAETRKEELLKKSNEVKHKEAEALKAIEEEKTKQAELEIKRIEEERLRHEADSKKIMLEKQLLENQQNIQEKKRKRAEALLAAKEKKLKEIETLKSIEEIKLQQEQTKLEIEEEKRKRAEIEKQRINEELQKIETLKLLEKEKQKAEKEAIKKISQERRKQVIEKKKIQSNPCDWIQKRMDRILLSAPNDFETKNFAIKEFNKPFLKGNTKVIIGLLDLISGFTEGDWEHIKTLESSEAVENELNKIMHLKTYNTNENVINTVYFVLNVVYWDNGGIHESKIIEFIVLKKIKAKIVEYISKNDKEYISNISNLLNLFENLFQYNKTKSGVTLVTQFINYLIQRHGSFRDTMPYYSEVEIYNNRALTHKFDKVRDCFVFINPTILHDCLSTCFRVLAANAPESEHRSIVETIKAEHLLRKTNNNKKYYHNSPKVKISLVKCIEKIGTYQDYRYLCEFDNSAKEDDQEVVNAVLHAKQILIGRRGLTERAVIISPAIVE